MEMDGKQWAQYASYFSGPNQVLIRSKIKTEALK